MLAFCGQEKVLIDANGRLRLPQRFADDFNRSCQGSIVMYGLPEGAIALYPEAVFREMRERELAGIEQISGSFLLRRSLRRFGSLSCPDKISPQGRITLPEVLRGFAGLSPSSPAVLVGVEIGLEIWEPGKLQAEMSEIENQMQEFRRLELQKKISDRSED